MIKINTEVNILEIMWLYLSGVMILYWTNNTFLENGFIDKLYFVRIMGFILIGLIISKFLKWGNKVNERKYN